eukprot:CAMPEP_0174291244 /NCGR_PEP_ID=MMETSP0809-20121228/31441_1 /TAXON_ID=73025 ORGANISM="Eutreptiella gymnastica-like, Strain CCMP1594" /NCGR_SAMPLE_ID=MMETSP0809 /ASSEMBLY_ACC=CAM_ASM_000658 /LENGTH=48 /DNA_ID= /DNA_START= /DNA_END= /DNA_ORIENTATION=
MVYPPPTAVGYPQKGAVFSPRPSGGNAPIWIRWPLHHMGGGLCLMPQA